MSTFSIQGKSLKLNTAEDIQPHLDVLKKQDEVTNLVFSGNTLGVGACEALAEVIKTLPTLQSIDLSDIFTGRLISEIPQALTALCNSLIDLPALHTVDLSDNAFGGRSVQPMVPYLSSSYKTLRVLKLNNNGLGPEGGQVIAEALYASAHAAKDAGVQPKLEVIICGRNRLQSESAPYWGKAFSEFGPSIREIRMFQNGIRMEGIQAIALGLRPCTGLQRLDLQDNTATEKGSRAIASSLKSWKELVELNLSDCLLRPKGGMRIMEELGKGYNTELKELKVQSDELDDRSVELLTKAVTSCLKKLDTIEWNGNRSDPEDAALQGLKAALEANGFEDALDEIDDIEEVDEEEEEEEEEEVVSESEDVEAKQSATVVSGREDEAGENVRASEASVVRDDKAKEAQEPSKPAPSKEDDDLANMLGKVELK